MPLKVPVGTTLMLAGAVSETDMDGCTVTERLAVEQCVPVRDAEVVVLKQVDAVLQGDTEVVVLK